MKTIAVIGGGITGVTTAYALAKRGFSVTLFERHRYAAMETSFANGGQLSASNGLCCTSRKADEITPAPDAAMPWHPRAPCSGARVA